MTDVIPQHLGPYRIVHEIGHSSRGVVYLAEDSRFGRLVALREIPASWTSNPGDVGRLRQEAHAAATLSHQNVAAIYALERIDDRHYLASEFVPGRSLREELQRGPLPPGAVIPLAREIAAGLAHLHRGGVTHRHLRSETVMRTPEGRIKIIGLGAAGVDQSAEQSAGSQADQYAFGALLRELASGSTPLDAVAERCLGLNHHEHFPGMEAVVEALDALGAGGAPPSTAPAPGALTPLWWWQCHQLITSLAYGIVLYFLWAGRDWLPGPAGQRLFIAGVIAALTANTLRLHVWIASLKTPEEWDARRQEVWAWTRLADFVLGATLLLAGARHLQTQPDLSTLFLGSALLVLIAFIIIEPATARAATGTQARRER